ncbi:phage tail length tape measure family protein [Achromobacter sp.]|uniref:phage tail length tape measure family protein n=1 Tax=Achromobacter sp. TaxID=134375 RepID=UPI002585984A|nr:phage tail length tape measure family protein [Achromobacter sp.]
MAGNTLAVDIVAKTDGLTAGLARATGQLDAFSASVSQASTTQAAASGEQSLQAQALTTAQVWVASRRAMIDAETHANTVLRAGRKADAASLGDALATMEQRRDGYLAATRAYYGSLGAQQQAAFATQEAAANKEIEAEYQRLAARLDDATAIQSETAALDENTAATVVNGSTAREATYMLDEIASGRFRRLGGSSVVLANRMGLLSKVFTPMGLAISGTAVAAGVLTAAFIEGERQSDAFDRAVLSTNDAMGVTQGRFESMAAAIAGGDITVGAARSALLTLAQSGRFTGSTLQEAATAAVDFADLTNQSMKQAASAVEQLAGRPLQAAVKLNDEYHFLTAAEYQHIAALAQEGNAANAAKAAIDAFGAAMHARAEQSMQDEGYVVRGWEDIKQGIMGAWNALESFGRTDTVQRQIAGIENQLQVLKATDPYDASGAQATLEARLRTLQAQERQNAAVAKAKSEQDQMNAAGVRAAAYLDKQVASLKTVNAELAHEQQITTAIEALHRSDPSSKLLQGDQFNAQGHLSKGNATYDQLIGNIQRKFDSHPVHIRFAGVSAGSESTSGVEHMLTADRTILEAAQRSADQQERITEQVNSIDEAAASRHSQAMLQIKIQQLRTEEAEGQITHAQELSDEQALYRQEYAAQLVAYQKELALEKGKPAVVARINAEIEALQDQHLQRMTAAQEIAAEKQAKAFQQAFAPISSAFTTSINGIIQGTQTLQMATDRILSSILLKYLDTTIQTKVAWVASEAEKTAVTLVQSAARTQIVQESHVLRIALSDLEKMFHIQTEAAKTTATITGEGVRTAAVVAGTQARVAAAAAGRAEGKAAEIAANQGTIMSAAATGAAGAYKALAGIPIIGPVLGAAAAVLTFGAIEAYKNMASFDVGAWSIPHDMPAMVHRGETILPRPFADDFRSVMSGRGGGGGEGGPSIGEMHLHVHAADGDSVARLFHENGHLIAASLHQALRTGWAP